MFSEFKDVWNKIELSARSCASFLLITWLVLFWLRTNIIFWCENWIQILFSGESSTMLYSSKTQVTDKSVSFLESLQNMSPERREEELRAIV